MRPGPRSTIVAIAVPLILGASAAIYFGAYDYGPWLASPWLWLGVIGSVALGAAAVRAGRASPRGVVVALVGGLIAFAVGYVVVLLLVVFVVLVWQPRL